ncbi:MAG TPA: DUF4384 domain-containing protein [Bryobacteraceae bacterium]|jgi:hypothetical protein|nr:DUF4384 domain-containing protein [Bryobacteraceae bacterium]
MRGRLPWVAAIAAAGVFPMLASAQSSTMAQGSHRMEITLERLDGGTWHSVNPALVLSHGDRVRFRFRTNFDGYLYVMNQSTSGTYEQLFPRDETGQDNKVAANKQYQVPATSTAFRIDGPPGFETVYWLVTPAKLTDAPPHLSLPANAAPSKPLTLLPRCDDTVLKARGDCIDHEAGPKLIPRDAEIPQNLAGQGDTAPRELLFLQQKDTSVISSAEPLAGPVIYQFRLAHK